MWSAQNAHITFNEMVRNQHSTTHFTTIGEHKSVTVAHCVRSIAHTHTCLVNTFVIFTRHRPFECFHLAYDFSIFLINLIFRLEMNRKNHIRFSWYFWNAFGWPFVRAVLTFLMAFFMLTFSCQHSFNRSLTLTAEFLCVFVWWQTTIKNWYKSAVMQALWLLYRNGRS